LLIPFNAIREQQPLSRKFKIFGCVRRIRPGTIGCNLGKFAVMPDLVRNARTVTHDAVLGPSRAVV
jgi:hypothetical protein